MDHRTQRALLGFALLWTTACQLDMGSRGERSREDSPDPVQGLACGASQCGVGQVCCNASCGICASTDSLCIQTACDADNDDLTCADLACGTGETCMQTPAGAVCVPAAEDPCVRARCAAGERCLVVGGAATCEPLPGSSRDAGSDRDAGNARDGGRSDGGTSADGGASDAGSTLDAATSRDAGTSADGGGASDSGLTDTGAASEDASADAGKPDATVPTCANIKCPPGSYCDMSSGAPRCLSPSCDGKICAPGKHCELAELACVTPPCPKAPICVDDPPPVDLCKEVKCKAGQHCEVSSLCADGNGIVPPVDCLPKGVCVSDGPPGSCGDKTCQAGTFCCNASCGICASKKGACLDVICEPGPLSQ